MSTQVEQTGYHLARCATCNTTRAEHLGIVHTECPGALFAGRSFVVRSGDEWCSSCDDWAVNCECGTEDEEPDEHGNEDRFDAAGRFSPFGRSR